MPGLNTPICPGSNHVWYIQRQTQGLPHHRQQDTHGCPGKEEVWKWLSYQHLPPLPQISPNSHPCCHQPNALAWRLGGSGSVPTLHSSHPIYHTHHIHTTHMQHAMHTQLHAYMTHHVQQIVYIQSTHMLHTYYTPYTHHRRNYILLLCTIHTAHDI